MYYQQSFHFAEFAACKSAEDDTISLVDTCKEKMKCGGASSKADAETQLKALTPYDKDHVMISPDNYFPG